MLNKGASTPDLASACVLHPLNRLVLDFTEWVRGGEQAEVRRCTGLETLERVGSERRS